jgi:hypothetical protein
VPAPRCTSRSSRLWQEEDGGGGHAPHNPANAVTLPHSATPPPHRCGGSTRSQSLARCRHSTICTLPHASAAPALYSLQPHHVIRRPDPHPARQRT